MQLPENLSWLELPLLKRELIENSHKKRTYILRILVALIFMLVMLIFYAEQIARYSNVLQVMGRGRELAAVLLVCNLVAIYILLPSMACSAISSEREKQTLSLILITRITPGGLIAEKFLSRLVPMIALMLITLPMLSISYLLGGLRLESVFAALLGLFTAAVQVNSTAIMCSALFQTALEAFWATYILFAIMALGPLILYEMDLLPNVSWFPVMGNDVMAATFVLFLGMSVGAIEGFASVSDVLMSAIPPLTVAVAMLVMSRFAISNFQQDAPLSFQTFGRFGRRLAATAYRLVTVLFRRFGLFTKRLSHTSVVDSSDDTRPPRPFPALLPVAWRERQISALSDWKLHATILGFVLFSEWGWLISEASPQSYYSEEICVVIDVGLFIVALLMVIGVACRTFSSERERQTLDLLLTTPLTNRELLRQKLAAANRTTLFLLIPIFLTGLTHLLWGRVRVYEQLQSASVNYYSARDTFLFEPEWWSAMWRYLFGLFSHAILYMVLVKWIAVYFSLKLNSQMKAMLGTIITVIVLCIVPPILTVLPLLLFGTDPDRADLPIWYFTSPVLIYMFNELHEFHQMFRGGWWPHSEFFTLLVNLGIYGSLTLVVRSFVIWLLPDLLDRRDSESQRQQQESFGLPPTAIATESTV